MPPGPFVPTEMAGRHRRSAPLPTLRPSTKEELRGPSAAVQASSPEGYRVLLRPYPAQPHPRDTRKPLRFMLLAIGLGLTVIRPLQAQDASEGPPVLLNADELVYDETLGTVTASGNVELAQENRIVFADRVTYNQQTKVVTATGNVSLLEPNGDVLFGEYAELTDDLAQGFVDHVRVLMTDNSRLAANEGERTDQGRFLRLNRVVYSPCELCQENPAAPPLWQVRAQRVVHDKEAQEIIYRDAVLEMFGLPVFYTPYLSHPDPTVEQKSGFLAPSFGLSSNIGSFATLPYYWAIGPDQDATISPTYSEEDGLQILGEYRRRFESGVIDIQASLVRTDREEGTGSSKRIREDQWRGHLFATGRFNLDDTWRTGFDLEHASDESYLRRYGLSDADILTSRVFAEGFRGRHYAIGNVYRFHDLRPGIDERKPLLLPLAEVNLLGEPNETFGGRWSLDAGLVGLVRTDGRDTRRASTTVGWERDFISHTGLVTTLGASIRTDAYYVTDAVPEGAPGGAATATETELRLFPQTQVTARYPLSRQFGSFEQVLEPIASLTIAPRMGDDPDIPNEDVTDIELTPNSLFRPNRFPGYDRLDSGTRITYGLNNVLYGYGGGYTELFLGQSYNLTADNASIPGSGLEEGFSDIVGQVRINPNSYFDLQYQFRLDNDTFLPRVHDASISAGIPIFRLSANYYYRDGTEGSQRFPDQEYLSTSISSHFARHWTAAISQSRNFEAAGNSLLATSAILTYADECFTLQLVGTRDYTTRSDIQSGDSIFIRLIFKNLGEFEAPLVTAPSSS
jgi:LPS-assembly protein